GGSPIPHIIGYPARPHPCHTANRFPNPSELAPFTLARMQAQINCRRHSGCLSMKHVHPSGLATGFLDGERQTNRRKGTATLTRLGSLAKRPSRTFRNFAQQTADDLPVMSESLRASRRERMGSGTSGGSMTEPESRPLVEVLFGPASATPAKPDAELAEAISAWFRAMRVGV